MAFSKKQDREITQDGTYLHGIILMEKGEFDEAAKCFYEYGKLGCEEGVRMLVEEYSTDKGTVWRDYACELGSVPAKYDVALSYEKGNGVEIDEDKALRLYTECAQAGYPDAYYRLGTYHESKHHTLKALEMYTIAEKMGQQSAKTRAQAMKAAVDKAEKLKAAAEGGDAKSQFLYAQCCEDGKGTEKDMECAFYWYMQAALAGNVKAQYRIGQALENGEGTEPNPLEAIDWYYKAAHAEKPYSVAYYRLYEIYSEGISIPKDDRRAREYLVTSANYGYTVAALLVARSYENGENGFEKNVPEAAKYYMKAAECNNTEAKAYVDKMIKKADSGDAAAQYFMWAYYTKKDRKQRSERGLSYLRLSANAGYEPAMDALGMKKTGSSVAKIPESPIPAHIASLTDEEIAKEEKITAKKNPSADELYELGMLYIDAAQREHHDIGLYVKGAEALSRSAQMGNVGAMYEYANCVGAGRGAEQSFEKAFQLYEKAYEGGEIRALTSMGMYYLRGKYVEIDKEKALSCFMQAAEKGDPEALYRLGKYYDGHNGDERPEYAFELCMKAAKAGHAKACLFIGGCYESGRGTEQDMKKALYWYDVASKKGLTSADYAIAQCYEKGKGVEKDEKRAFDIYMSAAMRENTVAQFRIGCCYEHGFGVEKNPHEAFRWYYVSAVRGNFKAMHALANCYEFGIGTERDMEAAVSYYEQAAAHGNSWSQYRMAVYYTSGIYTPRNTEEALRYCKMAAENKSAYAQYRMGRWYEKGFIVEQDMRKAAAYYKLSAEQGNPAAQCALGICYEEGRGIQKNITEAISLYGKSAHMMYAPAYYRLGMCCETGYGMEQDLSEALGYYEMAAALGYMQANDKIMRLIV